MEKDEGGKDGQKKEAEKEPAKDKGNETSDEDEVINYPNQPPIQNGFVVFIHQLNLSTTAKERRTVVEWISDALKLLDIHPQTITVDKLMEESIVTCTKAKVPVIKFSRPTGPNKTKQHEEQEPTAPSFRFKSRKQEDDHSVKSEFVNDNGISSRAPNNVNNNSSRPVAKVIQSKKKVFEKSKSGSISYGVSGQSSMNPTWKSAKIVPQKSVNSVTVKGGQRKPIPSLKPPQFTMDDKKQEYGVQLSVLRQKCRTMQKENHNHVWVLLIESRRRCIVDMGKLNSLATSFRFKVRWIAAQAPRSLDQSVFSVVNDIVQTKNISFPEQMKALRHRDKEAKTNEGKFSGRSATRSHNKAGTSKSVPVEVLHKTLSAQFDVLSLASFDMTQIMKAATNHHQPISSLPPSSDQTTKNDNDDTTRYDDRKEGATKPILNKKSGNDRKYNNKENNDSHASVSYESLTTTKSNSSRSLDQSTLSQ